MPKKPNTPQIITPVPRRFKRAWDEEFIRVNYDNPEIRYPGDMQKSLIALYLATADPSTRNETIKKGWAEFTRKWNGPDRSIAPAVRDQRHTYVTGNPEAVNIDGKSTDRLPRRKRAPKRTR